MKKYTYLLITLLIPAFVMVGCDDGNTDGGDKQITMPNSAEKNQQGYADNQTTGSFTFTAKSEWTAIVSEKSRASGVSWLRLLLDGTETYSGDAGTVTLSIEIDVNYTGETRSATITTASGTDKITVTVTQSGKTQNGEVPVAGVIINGVTWATCNVDAFGTFAAKPEDTGMFYQWNRPTAWLGTGLDPVSSPAGEVWDDTVPTGDEWEIANDPCPEGWRLPTSDEHEKLVAVAVTSEWTKLNGVDGRRFTDNESGASIFLPAAGCRMNSNGELNGAQDAGQYWSSSAYGTSGCCGWSMSFSPGGSAYRSDYGRLAGLSIRCARR